jgi:hypothetical protein
MSNSTSLPIKFFTLRQIAHAVYNYCKYVYVRSRLFALYSEEIAQLKRRKQETLRMQRGRKNVRDFHVNLAARVILMPAHGRKKEGEGDARLILAWDNILIHA